MVRHAVAETGGGASEFPHFQQIGRRLAVVAKRKGHFTRNGSAQRTGGKVSQPNHLAIRQGHARVGPIRLVKAIAKDHSPATVLDFQVEFRGIGEVHLYGDAGQAFVQDFRVKWRLAADVDRGHHRSPSNIRVIPNVVAVHSHHGLETLGRGGKLHPHLAVRGKMQAARVVPVQDAEAMPFNLVLRNRPGGVNQQIAFRRCGRGFTKELRVEPSVRRRHRFGRLRQAPGSHRQKSGH